MFARYYRFISRYVEPRYHPISVNVVRVLHAQATALEMEATELGVAVESLVRRELARKMRVAVRLKREVTSLGDYMKHWRPRRKRATEILDRALSSVANIANPSVYAVLNDLARAGHIGEEQPSAWRALRNPATHTDLDVDDALVQLVSQVRQLLIMLVFHVIAYRGPFTDQSVENWPVRQYPFPVDSGRQETIGEAGRESTAHNLP
jgi:hypothetical protein